MIFTYFRQPLNKYTFKAPKVKKWLEDHCKDKIVLNLFAGPTRINECSLEITVDLDSNMNPNYCMDALDFIRNHKEAHVIDVVILDPPYSYRKSMELYNGHRNSRFKQILDEIPKILRQDGKVITFGYHASVMSKCRGFKVDEILLIDHSGAQHTTIAVVESRIV